MATQATNIPRGGGRSIVPRSFRSRLTTIFVVIVLLPMVAVSVILFGVIADVERGRSDAQLAQAQRTAQGVYSESIARAASIGAKLGRSSALADALAAGDRAALERELQAGLSREGASAVLTLESGRRFAVGAGTAIAPATTRLLDANGEPAGTLVVALRSEREFAALLRSITGLQVVVAVPGGETVSTLAQAGGARVPRSGDVELGGTKYRVRSFTARDASGGGSVAVRLLADEANTRSAISRDSLWVGLLLLGFLVLAFAFALTVSRSLQAPVQRLLNAARRLGGGEFDVQVPEEGSDEFAQLGTEFNAMARQLEQRLEELDSERSRLQGAIRRVGQLSAAGLDRDAVLEIVVRTAVDGIGASAGRASARSAPGAPLVAVASVGTTLLHDHVLDDTEAAALSERRGVGLRRGDVHSLAQPLHPADAPGEVIGLITVAREGKPFSGGERDLFGYLASQASISIENVDLHRTVQRQAVTDELTGLFNHRRFQEVMSIEIERAKRFEQPLGLIMLDIDDFKLVNDRYGHLQGDQVLREVARVLLESSREVDEPARYGGEEMAIALPQTDLAGAALFAERLRERIATLDIPLVAGKGSVRVTASLGAAAFPDSAVPDKDALVAAADSALYRAKRLGKNRVVKAG